MESTDLEHPILVGIDGSSASLRAVNWAAAEAALRERPLALLYVKDYPVYGAPMIPVWNTTALLEEAAQASVKEAEEIARHQDPGLAINVHIVDGSAAKQLLKYGQQAELIVVGRRGNGGFFNLMLGSTALNVARHAQQPVIVVPAELAAQPEPSPGIVVGVDGSEYAQVALGFAFREASRRGATLTAVRAWFHPVYDAPALDPPFPPLPEDYRAEQYRVLAESLAGWQQEFPDVKVIRRVFRGHPAHSLVQAAAGAELLVVGARGEGGLFDMLLGSISESVIRHALCPVAVIHMTK